MLLGCKSPLASAAFGAEPSLPHFEVPAQGKAVSMLSQWSRIQSAFPGSLGITKQLFLEHSSHWIFMDFGAFCLKTGCRADGAESWGSMGISSARGLP